MRDILNTITKWWETGETFGLATVVRTFRSAPRDPGAALAVAAGGEVSFADQDEWERATIDKHGWLCAGDLEGGVERPADPDIPRLMRAAVTSVRGRR